MRRTSLRRGQPTNDDVVETLVSDLIDGNEHDDGAVAEAAPRTGYLF
jgi:hypothetical protein